MNDEIKEILDKLNKLEYDDIHLIICEVISRRKIKILLDYITNLQQENEHLSMELNTTMIERNNYLSRCEKANEYIKENKDKYYHDWGEDDGSYYTYLDETEIDKLSNILNGGNNE